MNSPSNLTAIDFENAYIQDLGVDISGILPGTRKYKRDYVKEALEENKKYRRLRRQKSENRNGKSVLNLVRIMHTMISFPRFGAGENTSILSTEATLKKQLYS